MFVCIHLHGNLTLHFNAKVPLNKAYLTSSRILEFDRGWSSGQQRDEGPGDGLAVGAAEHRTVRRGSQQSDHLRGERWRRQCALPPTVSNV